MKSIAAIFSIVMGVALIGTWAVMFALGDVADLMNTPFPTTCLLIAEAMTGLALIVAGAGVLIAPPEITILTSEEAARSRTLSDSSERDRGRGARRRPYG